MPDDPLIERRRTEYITSAEFSRTMTLLEEIRTDLKAGQGRLHEEMVAVGKRITDRQDVANGRLAKAETEIVSTITGLRVLEVKAASYRDQRASDRIIEQKVVADIKAELDQLMAEGCRVRSSHAADVLTLHSAGVLEGEGVGPSRWKRAAQPIGFSLGGLGLGVLGPHVGEILHWLAGLMTGTP